MPHTRIIAATFVAALAVSIPALAQELGIGYLRFALGQEQVSTMKEVSAKFTIVPVTGQNDTCFLSESKPPNVNVIGGLAFKNGRLSWIQRSWGNFSGASTATEATKALFAAIESAGAAEGTAANVSTKVQRVPEIEFKTITFEFGRRKVVMTSSEGSPKAGGKQVSITESVSTQ